MRLSLLGCLASTALGTQALAATPVWTISEASPGVVVVHAGLSKTAARGGHASPGDIVVTGANARAVLVRGEEYAVVAPNSRLQVVDAAETGGLMQMLERAGNVVFSVRKMASPHFGVQTPYLAAVVKGTTFSVTVDENGASVQVVEGAVEVATKDGGARELVLPGSVATVRAADLGTLTLQGPISRSVHSPLAGAHPVPAHKATGGLAQAIEPSPAVASPVALHNTMATTGGSAVIADAVEEAPQSLSDLTGGLVAGSTALKIAVATSAGSGAEHSVDVATTRIGGQGSTSSGTISGGSTGSPGAGTPSSGSGGGAANAGSGNGASPAGSNAGTGTTGTGANGTGSGTTATGSTSGSGAGSSGGTGADSSGSSAGSTSAGGSAAGTGAATGSGSAGGTSAGTSGSSGSAGTGSTTSGSASGGNTGSTTGTGASGTSGAGSSASGSTGSGTTTGSTGTGSTGSTGTGSTAASGTSGSTGTGTGTSTGTGTGTGTGTDNGKGNGGTNNGNQNGKGSGNGASSSSSGSSSTSGSTSTGTGTDNGKGNGGTNNGAQTGKKG